MRKLLIAILLLCYAWPASATLAVGEDSVSATSWQDRMPVKKIKALLSEEWDTTRDADYWKRALKHGKLDINDTSIKYPKFLGFCLDVYRWGDHFFNHYDSSYVVGTGKNWKVMVKNSNWMDVYGGHLTAERVPLQLNSNVTSTFGGEIAFMAVNIGYMLNVNDIITGEKMKNSRWQFSFTCSRASLEAYFYKDETESNLHRLGHFKTKAFDSYRFSGLSREMYGIYGYYYFNHNHYAQAAAYCFSKIQRKSAGSFITGIHITHQDIHMDFTQLSQELQEQLPDDVRDYRFRYRDYSFLVGYGYNWAYRPHWLFNVTATPGIGYRHSFPNSIDGKKEMFSMAYKLKLALVLNRGNWFYGAHMLNDGHWYRSKKHSFFNMNHFMNLTVGFRF